MTRSETFRRQRGQGRARAIVYFKEAAQRQRARKEQAARYRPEAWDPRSFALAEKRRKKLRRAAASSADPYVILYAQRPMFDA
jgi:hypothetical protein